MEKNKGLFSFRKHPVGDFPDGKKGRKRKGGRLRRSMGFLMAAVLIFNTLPASGLAVSASEQEKGLCEHHRSHTSDCGYREAQPCTHEHGEECYKTVTECAHEHTDECYPETEATEESTGEGSATDYGAEGREPENCTHVCSEESGCITKVLDCHHEHDENCGYQEAQDCGYVCEICNGTELEDTENNAENDAENAGTDTAECICETLCTEDSINGDCPVCGTEDADLSRCKGEKTKEQEKTGEKVITAWEWIDPEEYLTDGMLALPGAGRENPAFVEDVTALLPEKIQAKVAAVNAAEDGEETEEDAEAAPETEDAEITLTGWKCASYPEDGAYEGTYTFTAFLPEGFVLAEDAAALEVEVELGGGEMLLRGGESVVYQKAAWDESKSEVVCTEETADSCTPVENSAAAVTWYNGWYVVNGNVTISEPITVSGEVNLILVDGCTLTAEKGIVVTTGNSLTIYAQSGGTGTLNATGTTDSSNNASAGIGGSTTIFDSGSITIHGGVINATGGASRWYSGAGIGGSTPSSGNGGNSGTIKIYGGTITAESRGFSVGAGIGGGGSGGTGNGGAGTNISIYGGNITAMSYSDDNGGAGIGGGSGQTNGGTGNITIGGGTIHSTGGSLGAGIGGGSGDTQSGNGTVTISGGKVTAVGGNYAAGIGGGGGTKSQYLTWIGGIGSVTITGGIVDAKGNGSGEYAGAPIGNGGNTTATATVNKTTGIVFENGAGTVCGDVTLDGSYTVPADYTLNIPAGASLSGSGTLSGGSAFTTENLTEDMISVPEDWHYTGEDLTEKIKGAASLNGEVTICGQTFTASTDGWELSVEKVSELEYTVKYTHTDKGTLSKTVTIARGQTALSDVVTYKEDGTTPANTFSVGETIIVKATATFPANNAIMAAAEFDTPAGEQMAVYYNDTQISAPSTVENGVHTMTVDTSNLPESALNKEIGLTVKYIESGNASGATATTNVTVTAVARVKKDSTTTYVGALADAFTEGNSGATVTLLSEVDLGSNYIGIRGSSTFTLDLNGQTVKASHYGAFYISGGSLTIQDSGTGGKIESSNITIEVTGGTLSIKSGTVSGLYGVNITSGTVNISGGTISGTENGLCVNGGGNIALSGGAFIAVPSRHNMKPKDGKSARPRFHVYFPHDLITSEAECAALKKAIRGKFPFFDEKALDSARFIFGNQADGIIWHEGEVTIDCIVRTQSRGIPQGQRNSTMSHFAGRVVKRYGATEKAHGIFLEEASKCEPPLEDTELDTIWQSACKFARKVQAQDGYVEPEEYNDEFCRESLKPADYSDIGQAKVLAKEYGIELRYTSATDYLRFGGQYWIESKQQAVGAMEEFLDLQLEDAKDELQASMKALSESGVKESDIRSGGKTLEKQVGADSMGAYLAYLSAKAYHAFVMKRRDMKYVVSALQAAKPMLEVSPADLDKDAYSLNCPDGTYDLHNGLAGRRDHTEGTITGFSGRRLRRQGRHSGKEQR